jgi:hypothetical protein
MHSTIATGEKKLEDLLVGGEGVDPNETSTKRMTLKFYKSTMNKTKVDYEELVCKSDIHEGHITKLV